MQPPQPQPQPLPRQLEGHFQPPPTRQFMLFNLKMQSLRTLLSTSSRLLLRLAEEGSRCLEGNLRPQDSLPWLV